jgi:PIN domain nuclease of toxin-antitoxin system
MLLDSHVVYWAVVGNRRRLSPRALGLLTGGLAEMTVSSVVIWELAIKRASGKLKTPPNLIERLDRGDVRWLSVTPQHADHVANLPLHHADPFDRLLVAQAQLEGLPILSADPELSRYDVDVIW